MENIHPQHVRTGDDPRPFPDFILLRDEMSKQAHPARPDIHWDRVEQGALALFKKNGIELQTAAWYTLARSHRAQIDGMNEGLTIILALLNHQWAQFWPPTLSSRTEILAGLFQRLQKVLRTFNLSDEDYPALQQLESTLESMHGTLARKKIPGACQITPLLHQVRNALIRGKNEARAPSVAAEAALPDGSRPQLLYVIQPAKHVRFGRVSLFLGGMLTAFMLSAASVIVRHYLVTRY